MLAALAVVTAGCASGNHTKAVATPNGSGAAPHGGKGEITLYTSITQNTVTAVIDAFHKQDPAVKVNVFRAPTGSLNARIAADQRSSGGLKADILWVSDPLTMHGYDTQQLLEKYSAPAAKSLPASYRADDFAGAGLLYLVIVYHKGLSPAPSKWADLANPAYKGKVALPDPGFAGSAMGALGYFGGQPSLGMEFYRQLKANGAKQVKSPEDVITGVAQGTYDAGITIADSAIADITKGSPISIAWPRPGAIAIYSPIGVTATSRNRAAAEAFENFVLSRPGQQAIAQTGRQPSLPGVQGIAKPTDAKVVSPDWPSFFGQEKTLFANYQKIFGG